MGWGKPRKTKEFVGGVETTWKDLRDEAVSIKKLKAITKNQGDYLRAMEKSVVTICDGPAGSGKTYMACGWAAQLLKEAKVEKIIISRPLVTCGKGVGFLPGELDEKVGPYMRPLLDAFGEFFSPVEIERHLRSKIIEMLPLDLMRGTSLKKSVLICDEAQNAEYQQLHMFLTRFGQGSRVIVTGDSTKTQTDLTHAGENPFRDVTGKLRARGSNPAISFVTLTREDIVRHPLIQWIDEALSDEALTDEDWHEAWYSLRCPSCREKLWYCNGDESDLTVEDVTRIKCWSCLKKIEVDDTYYISPNQEAGADETFPAKS